MLYSHKNEVKEISHFNLKLLGANSYEEKGPIFSRQHPKNRGDINPYRDIPLTHACFQTYWISTAFVDINGNQGFCCLCSCKALGLLYTCACLVLEHAGLWARCWAPSSLGWVGLPCSLPFWWNSYTSSQNLWANKSAWKHGSPWQGFLQISSVLFLLI